MVELRNAHFTRDVQGIGQAEAVDLAPHRASGTQFFFGEMLTLLHHAVSFLVQTDILLIRLFRHVNRSALRA